jgi:hypothetical protein
MNPKKRLQRMMELTKSDTAAIVRDYERAVKTCYALGGISAWLGDASIQFFKDMARQGVRKEELARLVVFYEEIVDRKWRY